MSADHRDAKTGNKLCQRAMAALFNGFLQSLIGFHAEALRLDDILPVLLQCIQISEVFDPTMADKLLQRCGGESLDIHAGFFAEMVKLLNQFGCTGWILAKQLLASSRQGMECEP